MLNKYNYFGIILIVFICLALSSCKKEFINDINSNYPTHLIFEDEARVLDIPFPIDTEIWKINRNEKLVGSKESHDLALKFQWDKGNKNESMLDFYLTEMDYSGWAVSGKTLKFKENCLVFEKISKVCVVIIKELNNAIEEVCIFIIPKKYFE